MTDTNTSACLYCVYKHLSQCLILHTEEVPNGYPSHIRRVVGHLAEASRESLPLYPELAEVLRKHRLKVMETSSYLPPYNGLLEYVESLIALDDPSKAVSIPPEIA